MPDLPPLPRTHHLNAALTPALRSALALGAPVLLATLGHFPLNLAFFAIAAHGLAILDIRGPYVLRTAFLLTVSLLLAAAAELGTQVAPHPLVALLATALIALTAGLFRHLTPDYGSAISVPFALMFFMALVLRPTTGLQLTDPGLSALAGGFWSIAIHVALWPLRPQHPLRRAVSNAFLAAADVLDVLSQPEQRTTNNEQQPSALATTESALRASLDTAFATLNAASVRRRPAYVSHLDALGRSASRITTRAVALHTSLDTRPDRDALTPAFSAAAESLANTARAIALVTVSRQPAHLAVALLRLRRASGLLHALPLKDQIADLAKLLDETADQLRHLTERENERAVFPVELFDLRTWKLHPFATVLALRTRVDRNIARFTARLSLLLTACVAAITLTPLHKLPHAYWLPFTAVLILQPDFGATKQKALQRLSGTLFGALAGSALLYLPLPHAAVLASTVLSAFLYGLFLRTRYAVAVVFVTTMVVGLTELSRDVSWTLTAERLLLTTAGGVFALATALLFWPTWERLNTAPLISNAFSANLAYLRTVNARLQSNTPHTQEDIAFKQNAERANAAAFASLGRMYADPQARREGIERAALYTNASQRLTRIFSTLLFLPPTPLADSDAALLTNLITSLDATTRDAQQLFFPAHPAAPLQPTSAPALTTPVAALLLRAQAELAALQT